MPQIDSPTTMGTHDGHADDGAQRRALGRRLEDRVVGLEVIRLRGAAGAVDAAGEALVAGDAPADRLLGARAERGDERQARRGRARELGARIVEQDAARLRGHEVVGALEDLAERGVEAHVPVLGVLVAPRAHEEARDLLGRQRDDRPRRDDRRRHRELLRPHPLRHSEVPRR
jgi:hypothetical protein